MARVLLLLLAVHVSGKLELKKNILNARTHRKRGKQTLNDKELRSYYSNGASVAGTLYDVFFSGGVEKEVNLMWIP